LAEPHAVVIAAGARRLVRHEVSRAVTASLFSLDHWWEVLSLCLNPFFVLLKTGLDLPERSLAYSASVGNPGEAFFQFV
jgi:hypothetical protein